jgi:ABC-type multidrug transport system fused ATPase/permease subunit
MHKTMTSKVLKAPLEFFEKNSSGKVISRFSKDLTILDMLLPPITVLVTNGIFRAIAVFISVSIVNPILIGLVVIFVLLCVKIV